MAVKESLKLPTTFSVISALKLTCSVSVLTPLILRSPLTSNLQSGAVDPTPQYASLLTTNVLESCILSLEETLSQCAIQFVIAQRAGLS